jgi:hypothetical protein
MLNVTRLGSEGLAANAEEATKLGLALDRVDAAKVEAANDAMARASAAATGIGQTFTVAIAPYIEAGAERLVEWATAGEGASSRVNVALAATGGWVGKLADWFELPKVVFYNAQISITTGLALIAEGVQGLIDGTVYLLNLLPGVEIEASRLAGTFADNAWDAVAESGRKADEAWKNFQDGSNSRAVADFIAKTQADAQAQAEGVAAAVEQTPGLDEEAAAEAASKVQDELDKLQASLDQFGQDPITIKLDGLREAGATAEQLDKARASMEKLARLERDAERRNTIAEKLDDIESRVRTFGITEEQRTLLDLEAAGATEEQLARAREAFEQLAGLEAADEAKRKDGSDTNDALRAGSAEAQLAAFRGRDNAGSDEIKKQTDLQTRMADGIEEINRRGDSIFGGSGNTIKVVDL